MDKLKPILAHKFWIFFGLVLILPIVGYFMTKGELAAQIESRWAVLDKTFNEIPSGQNSPNEEWTRGLQVLNDQQKLNNRLANDALWRRQREKMRWPSDIAAVMNKAEYFKPVPPEQGGLDAQFKYQYDYPREIRRLWEIVDPMDDGKNLRDSDKRRKIFFSMRDLYQTNTARWADLPPTFEDIWECQEDIWLQTELLQAIARVNAGSISQGDSFVKQLGKILFFGGAKAAGDAGAAAASSGPAVADGGMFSGGMPMSGRQSNTSAVSVDINYSEEFVLAPDPNSLSGGTGGGGGMPVGGGFANEAGSPALTSGSGGATGATGAKSENKRYIDDDPNQPYKRRGFYIKVVMDHTKVPDLIAELMNSPFPVEIVRVQQVWLSDSAAPTSGGGGSPFGAGGAGVAGFGGFNRPGGEGSLPGPDVADDPGSDAFPTGGSGGSPRPSTGGQVAMSDPNLAHVAILGVWTLYRPPAPAADGAAAPATDTAAPNPEVAGTAPAASETTEAPTAETEAKPATSEPAEKTGDDSKTPENSESPKAESANPEKKESETKADPAADKPPTSPESDQKPATESKS